MEINKNVLKVCGAMLVGGLIGGFIANKCKKLEVIDDEFSDCYAE